MCERCAHEAPNPQALAYHIKVRLFLSTLYILSLFSSLSLSNNLYLSLYLPIIFLSNYLLINLSLFISVKIVHEGLTFPCDMCEFVGTTYSRMAHHKTREHGQ